jgi:hypothetical protein
MFICIFLAEILFTLREIQQKQPHKLCFKQLVYLICIHKEFQGKNCVYIVNCVAVNCVCIVNCVAVNYFISTTV